MSNIQVQKYPSRVYQDCPLCGEKQIIQIRGLSPDLEAGGMRICPDIGYSFCNCNNIFFTNWDNIRQNVYDEVYYDKYKNEDTKNISIEEFNRIYAVIKKLGYSPRSILEIGAITDHVLDSAKGVGLDTKGIDICEHGSNHEMILGDFEAISLNIPKVDLIWASHIFEHFKDPGKALEKCRELINDNGILYIAMPDTFFINFEDPSEIMNWDWAVREHHILWNMDSFVKFAENCGFKVTFKERSTDLFKQQRGDWFWKKDFKVLLCANQL